MSKENKMGFCTIYIARYGKTEWNLEKINQGQSESNISEIGLQQAKEASHKLKDVSFSAAYSSDLSMAYRSAEIIKGNRDINIQKSKSLRGRSYGSFEGKKIEVYKEFFKAKLAERELLSEDEYISFRLAPDIETDEDITIRFMDKLREISTNHLNESVLVVTHGGDIKNFLVKVGYIERKSLKEGSFIHGGYMKVLSDGNNFSVELMDGIGE